MSPAPPRPHPALTPLLELVGTWEGEGIGDYPTIETFRYREQVVFGQVGRPFLTYVQRTWHPEHGSPMHAESGYLRVVPDTTPLRIELVVAQPTGLVEVHEGELRDGALELASTAVVATGTATPVDRVRRRLWVEGEVLHVELAMAAGEVPETEHLRSRLHRVPAEG